MSFFKFSKSYTTDFGCKVRVINIDRIFGTSDENLTVSFIDGDFVVIDESVYNELEDYLLYESESESEAGESEAGESEEEVNQMSYRLFKWII